MQIKLLSLQPGSLYENGGAARVLRRFYVGHEENVTALYARLNAEPPRQGPIKEVAVPVYPFHRSWMRWHLRTLGRFLRDKFFFPSNAKRIVRAAAQIDFDVIHVINHGSYSAVLCNAYFAEKPLWVSFHDHYSTCGNYKDSKTLWERADRRIVISEELGSAYQQAFGHKEFELLTDGVLPGEVSVPTANSGLPVCIYFAGLLHIEYLPQFRVLADALDLLLKEGLPCKLVLRGTQPIGFLNGRSFVVEYLQNYVTDQDVKKEMDEADILYLPIKFSIPDFYLYSLSTKMVGYLGSSGSILYHGPEDSAACKLLSRYQASENCTSFDALELKEKIINLLRNKYAISSNAKKLANSEFNLLKLRAKFWNAKSSGVEQPVDPAYGLAGK